MIKLLGTPCPENWPDIDKMPDYGKIIFKEQEPIDLKQYFEQLFGGLSLEFEE